MFKKKLLRVLDNIDNTDNADGQLGTNARTETPRTKKRNWKMRLVQ